MCGRRILRLDDVQTRCDTAIFTSSSNIIWKLYGRRIFGLDHIINKTYKINYNIFTSITAFLVYCLLLGEIEFKYVS